MAQTKLSIPFLVLTRQRKSRFLEWARRGFRAADAASILRSSAHSVSPSEESASRFAGGLSAERSTKARTDRVAFGRAVMPGTRRNGHCLSCCCLDCAVLVKIDAEKFFDGK